MKTVQTLEQMRKNINAIDRSIITLLIKRLALAEKIGEYKKKHALPLRDSGRWNNVLEANNNHGLPTTLVQTIWSAIHVAMIKREREAT